MGRSLTEIAALLDEVWDDLLEFTGGFVDEDHLDQAGVEIYDSVGKPIDFREIASQLRAADAALKKQSSIGS